MNSSVTIDLKAINATLNAGIREITQKYLQPTNATVAQLSVIAGPLCSNPSDSGVFIAVAHVVILVIMATVFLLLEKDRFLRRQHRYRTTKWAYNKMIEKMTINSFQLEKYKVLELNDNPIKARVILKLANKQMFDNRHSWFISRNGAKLTEMVGDATTACTGGIVSTFLLAIPMATELATLVECVDPSWRDIFRVTAWIGLTVGTAQILLLIAARLIVDAGYAERMFWNALNENDIKTNGFRHGDNHKYDGAQQLFLLHREEKTMIRTEGETSSMSVQTNRRANQAVEYGEDAKDAFKISMTLGWQVLGSNLTAAFSCYLGVVNGRIASAVGDNMETATIALAVAAQWLALTQAVQMYRGAEKFRKATKLETALNTGNWTEFKATTGDKIVKNTSTNRSDSMVTCLEF